MPWFIGYGYIVFLQHKKLTPCKNCLENFMYFQKFLERFKYKIRWESISYKYDRFRTGLNLHTINIWIIFIFAWGPILHVVDYLALFLVSTIEMSTMFSHLWWSKSFPYNANISYYVIRNLIIYVKSFYLKVI